MVDAEIDFCNRQKIDNDREEEHKLTSLKFHEDADDFR